MKNPQIDIGLKEIIDQIRGDILQGLIIEKSWRETIFRNCLLRLMDVEMLQIVERAVSGKSFKPIREKEALDLSRLPQEWLSQNQMVNNSQTLYFLGRLTSFSWNVKASEDNGQIVERVSRLYVKAWVGFLNLMSRSPVSSTVILTVLLVGLVRAPEEAEILQIMGTLFLAVADYESASGIFGAMVCSAGINGEESRVIETIDFLLLERLKWDDEKRLCALSRVRDYETELPVGVSDRIREIRQSLEKGSFYPEDRALVFSGERGVGKRFLASCLHRWTTPGTSVHFMDLRSFGTVDELMRLFHGVAEGSRNSSMPSRGILEMIGRGTLILSGLQQAGPQMIEALRLLLKRGGFRRVGDLSSDYVPFNGRIIINQTIEKGIEKCDDGSSVFKLAEVLGAVHLHLPALRNRREDIPWLVDHFLRKWARDSMRDARTLDRSVRERLKSYSWPGNIAELSRVVDAMAELSDGKVIREAFLPERILGRFR
ncbi:MAG: hypothetical protein CVV64_07690 [Candidatus Wallbacteria bacterium HGW-Wallbacteria-1]|jgi:hypothetical protein|uniref:Sigma-54 factor interaction domain-containing protein n=1 Tax=Candidatus Wallbacteria bacterium HGW-Wallbacteria-1 TaxID=2013854 RepID=A0A2N1PR56_9BACT|nr:MAG: hypothetical protein CVV64_07690 [Candidatus Wallbacteria bacterium HGW-Wallbacteria-1]